MTTYRSLKHWTYRPVGLSDKWRVFEAGETFDYPGLQFPTTIPITWLLTDGAAEEVLI